MRFALGWGVVGRAEAGQEKPEELQAIPGNKGDDIQSSKLQPNRAPGHLLPEKEAYLYSKASQSLRWR